MWTPTTWRQHSRVGLCYETDLTDAEWAVIAPLMPRPAPCGRPRLWTTREVLNAIFYVLRGGISWRLIPKDLPPRPTTFGYFSRWRDTGLFSRINHHLVMLDRERIGREASPSAAVLDSQRRALARGVLPSFGRSRHAAGPSDGSIAPVVDPIRPGTAPDRAACHGATSTWLPAFSGSFCQNRRAEAIGLYTYQHSLRRAASSSRTATLRRDRALRS